MVMFSAFLSDSIAYSKEGNKPGGTGTLIILRDVPTQYRGLVYLIKSTEVPNDLVLGGLTALNHIKNNPSIKPVACLKNIDGECFVQGVPRFEETEVKDEKSGEIKKVQVEITGSLDARVEKKVNKMLNPLTLGERLRYCSPEQIIGQVVARIIREEQSPDVPIEKTRAEAVKKAPKEFRSAFSQEQMQLIASRLGQPKMLNASGEDVVDVESSES